MRRVAVLPAVAAAGFATLAIQVLAPRLLHPTFGSGAAVTSFVVAASLTGLAIGYRLGAGRGPRPLRALAVAVLACGVILLITAALWSALDRLPVGTPGLVGAALLLTGVPAGLLGFVSPVAVRLLTGDEPPSERPVSVPSLVFGIGTAANVVGGLATGFWLVPFVGLTRSLLGIGGMLVVTGLVLTAASALGSAVEERPAAPRLAGSPPTVELAALGSAGLLAIAFYSGFMSLAIEVGASRMLASILGPTTSLWASILSVGLGGLAIGYFVAGRVPRRLLTPLLPLVILANCAWLVGSTWFVSAIPPTASLALTSVVVITAVAFLVPFVLFGIESQLLVGIVAERQRTVDSASVTGLVFAVSTVGGVLGALSGALYLVPTLGLSTFVRLLALGYLVVAAVVVGVRRPALVVGALLAITVPLPGWRWSDVDGRLLAQEEGRYQTVRIYTDDATYLRFHLGPTFESEARLDDGAPRFGYALAVLDHVGDVSDRRVLVIGGAGHTLARAFEERGATVTEVELDPLVDQLSDRHFGSIDGEVVIGDGRRFVTDAPADAYDVIVVDVFAGPRAIPPHLTTVEFFHETRRALAEDGTLYMNMIGAVEGPRAEPFQAMSATIGSVFPVTGRIDLGGNVVLIAAESGLAELVALTADGVPNTDDLNPMEILLHNAG